MHIGHELHHASERTSTTSAVGAPVAAGIGAVARGSRAAPEHPPDADPDHPARSVGATRTGTWRLRYPSAPLPPRAASRAPRAAERTRDWSRPAPCVWSPIAAAAATVRWSRAPASSPGAAITSTSTVESERWSTRYTPSLPSTRWRNTPAATDRVSGGRTSRSRTATSLSLWPAGLADGLALKEQRYSRMSPRDSPQHLGSPAPSLPARDSACARQTTSPVAELQEYISNDRKLRPFARRPLSAGRDRRAAMASTLAPRPHAPAPGRGHRRRPPRAIARGPGHGSDRTPRPSGALIAVARALAKQPGGRCGAQQTRTGHAPEREPAPLRGQRPRKPGYVPPGPSRGPR